MCPVWKYIVEYVICKKIFPQPVACQSIVYVVNISHPSHTGAGGRGGAWWDLIVVLICIRSSLSLVCGVLVQRQLWFSAKCFVYRIFLKRERLSLSFRPARFEEIP